MDIVVCIYTPKKGTIQNELERPSHALCSRERYATSPRPVITTTTYKPMCSYSYTYSYVYICA